MSSASVLPGFHPQPGWFSQRYRGALPFVAYEDPFSSRPREVNGIEPADLARLTVLNCKTNTFHKHLPLRSGLLRPFKTHRAGIVERFSPIRF
jgi:hypothetical protein